MDFPQLRPMPLTVGGIPALENIVGRDGQVATVCRDLVRGQSTLLTGDRRMGKTTLARLIEYRLDQGGHRVVRTSAEAVSYADFVQRLARELQRTATGAARRELARWSFTVSAGPVEATRAGVSANLEDLIRRAAPKADEPPIVLIIDEVPVLAQAMERESARSGLELLHTLRRIRQDYSGRLAMLLMGSIGFHHITADAPGTMNDVVSERVDAIEQGWAHYLAWCLMLGEGVAGPDAGDVALAIAGAAESVPFYVQHLVKFYRDEVRRGRRPGPGDIDDLVEHALRDPDDPWAMDHYRDRLSSYYGDRAPIAEAILNEYAVAPRTIDDIVRALTLGGHTTDRPGVVRFVEKLERDHYLVRTATADRFASELVRRAWTIRRR